jgi:raffinose/stachyose/melibiose transport system substrate-binding protein
MRVRRRLVALSALALTAAVSACGGDGSDSPEGGGPVTLRALMPTAMEIGIEEVIADFRSTPEGKRIKIETNYADSSSNTEQQLQTQLQANNAPDLFFVNTGNGNTTGVWPLGEAGRLLALSEGNVEENVYEPALPGATYDNTLYTFPITVSVFGLLTNDRLFDELGLTEPETFADLLGICRQVADDGEVTALAQGLGEPVNRSQLGQVLFAEFVYNKVPDWNDQRNDGTVTFAGSSEWRRALEAVTDMLDAGCFPRGASGMTREAQYSEFVGDRGVFMFGSTTDIAAVQAIDEELSITMNNLPADDAADTRVYTSVGINLSVSATTEHKEEALTFMNFLADEAQLETFAEASRTVSPIDAAAGEVPDYLAPETGPALKAGESVNGPHYLWPNPTVFNDAYVEGIGGLATGQTSIDEILERMDEAWESES